MSQITVYTTPGCPDCGAVKRYFDQKGISYQEKDVTENSAWLDEMKQMAGVRIAPVRVIGDQAFYGTFDAQRPELDHALKSQEERSSSGD
jgi:glutaredoxin